jgi:hypothetical protein
VRFLLDSSKSQDPLRVDPRPLRDTLLVSFKYRLVGIPDSVRVQDSLVVHTSSDGFLKRRQRILEEAGVPETNVVRDAECPGYLLPSEPEVLASYARYCPTATFRSIGVGIPRLVPASPTPSSMAERSDTLLVRVVRTELHPHGSVETGEDWVFIVTGSQLRLLKRRTLSIVE